MYCSFLRNARYKDITIIKEDYTMPKMKTSRAAAKRFKTTGTGKLVRNKAYKSHILILESYKYGKIFFITLLFVASVTMSFLRFLFLFVDFLVKMWDL